jgi:hypothetical protein
MGPGGRLKRDGTEDFWTGSAGFVGASGNPTWRGTVKPGRVSRLMYDDGKEQSKHTRPCAGMMATGHFPAPDVLDVVSLED